MLPSSPQEVSGAPKMAPYSSAVKKTSGGPSGSLTSEGSESISSGEEVAAEAGRGTAPVISSHHQQQQQKKKKWPRSNATTAASVEKDAGHRHASKIVETITANMALKQPPNTHKTMPASMSTTKDALPSPPPQVESPYLERQLPREASSQPQDDWPLIDDDESQKGMNLATTNTIPPQRTILFAAAMSTSRTHQDQQQQQPTMGSVATPLSPRSNTSSFTHSPTHPAPPQPVNNTSHPVITSFPSSNGSTFNILGGSANIAAARPAITAAASTSNVVPVPPQASSIYTSHAHMTGIGPPQPNIGHHQSSGEPPSPGSGAAMVGAAALGSSGSSSSLLENTSLGSTHSGHLQFQHSAFTPSEKPMPSFHSSENPVPMFYSSEKPVSPFGGGGGGGSGGNDFGGHNAYSVPGHNSGSSPHHHHHHHGYSSHSHASRVMNTSAPRNSHPHYHHQTGAAAAVTTVAAGVGIRDMLGIQGSGGGGMVPESRYPPPITSAGYRLSAGLNNRKKDFGVQTTMPVGTTRGVQASPEVKEMGIQTVSPERKEEEAQTVHPHIPVESLSPQEYTQMESLGMYYPAITHNSNDTYSPLIPPLPQCPSNNR